MSFYSTPPLLFLDGRYLEPVNYKLLEVDRRRSRRSQRKRGDKVQVSNGDTGCIRVTSVRNQNAILVDSGSVPRKNLGQAVPQELSLQVKVYGHGRSQARCSCA